MLAVQVLHVRRHFGASSANAISTKDTSVVGLPTTNNGKNCPPRMRQLIGKSKQNSEPQVTTYCLI